MDLRRSLKFSMRIAAVAVILVANNLKSLVRKTLRLGQYARSGKETKMNLRRSLKFSMRVAAVAVILVANNLKSLVRKTLRLGQYARSGKEAEMNLSRSLKFSMRMAAVAVILVATNLKSLSGGEAAEARLLGGLGHSVKAEPAAAMAVPQSLSLATVTTLIDENDGCGSGTGCSLREAVAAISIFGGTVRFAVTGTITLTGGEIVISKSPNFSFVIEGPGADKLTVSGGGSSRVFDITKGSVTISGLTIADGKTGAGGGGISISPLQSLTMRDCTVSGNSARFGGGIYNGVSAKLTMINCTLLGNSSPGTTEPAGGGGIFNDLGTVTMTNCTVAKNSADHSGGGIRNNAGTLTMTNCTVAENSAGFLGGGGIFNPNGTLNLNNSIVANNSSDIGGEINSGGSNLIGQDPKLAPLGYYGGPTQTYALLCGSPAIDRGNNNLAKDPENNRLTTDQRGSARIVGGTVDIGAFESSVFLCRTFLPFAVLGQFYSQVISAQGVSPPYSFSPGPDQNLPQGLRVSSSGRISGTPTETGTFSFIVVATGSDGFAGACEYKLHVGSKIFQVNTTADNSSCDAGGCSLRGAIAAAGSGDTIQINVTGTITLTRGELGVGKHLMIVGPGADKLTVSGNNSSRVLSIGGSDVIISGLTIADGFSNGIGGGGIFNGGTLTMINCAVSGNKTGENDNGGGGIFNNGTLTMINCTVSGNSTELGGGGIRNFGTVTMTNCTVSGNGAKFVGGGIRNDFDATLTMTNCTVAENRAGFFGGGIEGFGTLNLKNSIVANNSAPEKNNIDVNGIVNSGSSNLIGQDPKLAPLGYYGGPTQTHALLCGSPAIDRGSNDLISIPSNCPVTTDQRGSARIVGGTVDIGAFEANISLSPTSLPDAPTNCSYEQRVSATGGSGNYTFSLGTGSSLPQGLTLSNDGTISGTPNQAGTFSFIIVAKDSGGFAGACQYLLNVFSSSRPSITCPGNITVNADPGKCSASVSFSVSASGDPAPTVTCTVNGQPISSPSTFPVGQTTVTCTASNCVGTANCSFTVTVRDAEGPSITCPSDITVVTRPGESSVEVNFPDPTATDNCAVESVSCMPRSGSSFSVGVSTVTCTATDRAGNISECSFRVVVFDACLQDDSDRSRVLLINSQTGDYVFCCGGEVFAGRGQVNRKGGLISLQHFGTDRRVVANIDLGFGRGSATLQFPPGVTKCTIMDRNTRDNNCSSCPPR